MPGPDAAPHERTGGRRRGVTDPGIPGFILGTATAGN
jgi:hypothetical protein